MLALFKGIMCASMWGPARLWQQWWLRPLGTQSVVVWAGNPAALPVPVPIANTSDVMGRNQMLQVHWSGTLLRESTLEPLQDEPL